MAKARQNIIATVRDKKGNILAVGANSYTKTHPIMFAFANKLGIPHKVYLHAEVAALVKAIKYGKPYSIEVERYDKKGSPKDASPCVICQEVIKFFGVSKVTYTVGD
jgi:cytidine deaminase